MHLTWIMVTLGLVVTAWTRFVPTVEDLRSAFEEAQRFYAAEAYDQAIEQYEKVSQVSSPLLHAEQVTVTVGDVTAPVREAALYQSGNAYFKLAQEALHKANRAATAKEREELDRQAQIFLERAAAFFKRVESEATVEALRVLAQNRLVTTWYEAKDYKKTIAAAQILIAKYSRSQFVVNAMYNIAWSYYDQQDYDVSIQAFEALIQRFPTGYRADRALFQIAECYYNQGSYEKAITYYQQLVARAKVYGLTERDLMRMRREKLAGLVDETALELAAKAQLKIGDGYSRMEQFDKATEAYKRVITLFSAERRFVEEGYRRLAEMYYQKGDLEQCIRTYRDAIDRVRDRFFQARMQSLMARRYYDSGHFDEAIAEYEVYIKGYDDVADRAGFSLDEAEYNIGRAYYEKGQQALGEGQREEAVSLFRAAIAQYERTLDTFPDTRLQVALRFNIALCQQFIGDESSMGRALEGFQRIILDYPDDPFVESSLFQIARIFYDRKEYDKAVETYQEVLRRFSDSPQVSMAHFELGICRRDQGRGEQAVEEFLMVPPESPLFSRTRVEAGEILIRNGAFDRALEVIDEAQAFPAMPEVRARYLYIKAKAFIGLQDYEQAVGAFTGIVQEAKDPRLVESSLYARGTALLSLGRRAEADRDFEHLVDETSDPALQQSARRMLAMSLIQQGREMEASRNYEALVANATDLEEKAEYLLLLAELYHGLKTYDQVAGVCQEILELDISDRKVGGGYSIKEKALFLLGDVHNRLEKYASVIDVYTDALQRYPNSIYAADMTFALGLAFMQTGGSEEAVSEFERFLDRYKGHANTPYALYYLGYVRFNQTEFEKTADAFERLVEGFPQSELASDAWFRMGESYFNLGRYEQALGAYRRVADDWPNSDQADGALYNGAWASLELGRGEEAVARLHRLLAEYPDSELAPSAQFTIGDYYYNEGQYEQALEAYERLLKDYPNNELTTEVPKLVEDLREAAAFTRYQEIVEDFRQAMADEDKAALRRILPRMKNLAEGYPGTETEVGILNNMGISYESLYEWKKAVSVYDLVMARYEAGIASPEAYQFSKQHRDWIISNRL